MTEMYQPNVKKSSIKMAKPRDTGFYDKQVTVTEMFGGRQTGQRTMKMPEGFADDDEDVRK